MAGAQVAISALPISTTVVTTDVLGLVIGGTTKKITAGNFRSQLFAYAATDPLNCGILTAVGNSTITGTLSGITTLSATSATVTTITATTLAGTLSTAAQPNVTSLGTLTALSVGGNLNMTAAVSRIVPGATSWAVMNNAGSVSNLLLSNAGFLQIFNGLQVSAGNVVLDNPVSTDTYLQYRINTVTKAFAGVGGGFGSIILTSQPGDYSISVNGNAINFTTDNGATRQLTLNTSGSLVFGPAASKIIPGATSFSHRNNADSADNLILTDAGVATIRAGLTVTAGGAAITGNSTITGTLGGLTGLTVASGNATVSTGNVVITAGNLTFAAASAKVIPGATSLLFRNNADSQTNLLIADNGDTTIRGNINMTAATGLTIGAGGGIFATGGTNKLIGDSRLTGYVAMTGTPDTGSSFATSTVTLAQLAGRVMSLQASLTTHGLIGT